MKKTTLLFALLFFIVQMIHAQVTITGEVTEAATGETVPGVSITAVDASGVGTVTDYQGKYRLEVPEDVAQLRFSFVGYQEKVVAIEGRTEINVALNKEDVGLDEVVVVAYGTANKSSFTGSASTVSSESLDKIPATSIEKSLQGSSPGIRVQSSSGQPGSATTVTIRGVGSLNASSQPLYVVDGVPVSSGNYSEVADDDYGTSTTPLSSINPDDIKSISVLKDASATALYGSRAANGVVIITTKQGEEGETSINVKAMNGFSDIAVPREKVLGAEDYMRQYFNYYHDEAVKSGSENPVADAHSSMFSKLAGGGGTIYNPFNTTTPFNADGSLSGGTELLYDTDWRDAVYRTGRMQKYTVSASGGVSNLNYYLSGGYEDTEGIVLGSNYKRYSGKINLNSEINDFIKVGANTTLSYEDKNVPPGAGGAANPVRSADIISNIYTLYERDAEGNKILDATGNPIYDFDNPIVLDFNPVYNTKKDIYNSITKRALTSVFAEVSFLKDFTFKTTGSADYYMVDETRYYNPVHGNGAGVDGRTNQYAISDLRLNLTNLLTWQKDLDVHSLTLKLGQEAFQSNYEYLNSGAVGFPFAGNEYMVAASTPNDAYSYRSEEALISYFSEFKYDFSDKYYLSASVRQDGSSVFGEDYRWGTFWSVGATWRLSQEDFIANVDWINDLKLRSSYGTSGNNSIGNYASLGLYSLGYNYNGKPGLLYDQLQNPDLKWEAGYTFDVGLEFSLFNNRLDGVIDYYKRGSDDLLFDRPLSYTTGFEDITTNLAKMENRGVELSLNSVNVQTSNFTWRTSFNISFQENEILELTQDEVLNGSKRWREGTDRYQFYIREFAGVNTATGMPMWYKVETDENGNEVKVPTENYNNATRTEQGSALPEYYGGFSNDFNFFGFDASIFFYYSIGGQVLDYDEMQLMHNGSDPGQQLSQDVLDAWKEPGDVSDVPRFVVDNSYQFNERSTRFLYDNSYIRLKNVTLGYTIPKKYTEQLGIQRLRIYGQLNNYLTIHAHKGLDPQRNLAGTTNNTMPNTKSIIFGLNFGL